MLRVTLGDNTHEVEGIEDRDQERSPVKLAGSFELCLPIRGQVDLIVLRQVLGRREDVERVGADQHGQDFEHVEQRLVAVGGAVVGIEIRRRAECVSEEDEKRRGRRVRRL